MEILLFILGFFTFFYSTKMDATKLLKRKESLALLENLPQPKNIWKFFLLCTETPRPSHKLDLFRSVLTSLAKDLDCESSIDSAGNVCFRAYVQQNRRYSIFLLLNSYIHFI